MLELGARAQPGGEHARPRERGTGLLEHTEGALLVADHRGRIIGAIVAAWDGSRGNLFRLAVLPEHRRRGIGRRLVEAGHDRLRARGARRVTALVARDEPDAAGLRVSTAYREDEHISRFVRNL